MSSRSSQMTNAAPSGAAEAVVFVRARNGLNLRAGPHTSYSKLTVLEDGTPVEAVALPFGAEVPGWLFVRAGEDIGWVSRHFVREPEA